MSTRLVIIHLWGLWRTIIHSDKVSHKDQIWAAELVISAAELPRVKYNVVSYFLYQTVLYLSCTYWHFHGHKKTFPFLSHTKLKKPWYIKPLFLFFQRDCYNSDFMVFFEQGWIFFSIALLLSSRSVCFDSGWKGCFANSNSMKIEMHFISHRQTSKYQCQDSVWSSGKLFVNLLWFSISIPMESISSQVYSKHSFLSKWNRHMIHKD